MKQLSSILISIMLIFAALVVAMPAVADIHSGSIAGVVRDTEGRPVEGVSIEIHHKFRADTFRAVSDAQGAYLLANLPGGTYSMYVKAKGYCAQWIPRVVVNPGEHVRQDISLTRQVTCELTQ